MEFRSFTDLWDETERAYSEEPAPWDVVVTDEMILAMFVAQGRVRPLDDLVARDRYDASDYLAASIDLARFHGSLYGIPYANMCNVLGYRRDLLERFDVGVPSSMEELVSTAQTVQSRLRARGDDGTYGFLSRGRAGHGFNVWILASTFFPAWGATWFDDHGRPALDSAATTGALEAYVRLLRDAGPPDASHLLWTEAHDRFEAGEAAFFIDAMTELTLMQRRGRTARGGDRRRRGPVRAEGGCATPASTVPCSRFRRRPGTSRRRGAPQVRSLARADPLRRIERG